MEKVLLMGAGALAADLVDLFGAESFAGAYVDPAFHQAAHLEGVTIRSDWGLAAAAASHYVLATSSIEHRARARAQAESAGLKPASPMISPTARLARTARLSPGCLIGHFCAVGPATTVGVHGLLMHGVVLGHDAVLGENVVVCAGAAIAGYVKIGPGSFIGTLAVLAPKVDLGRDCVVSAGAACLRSAPDGSLLVGNPARRMPKVRR
jgi:UDP-3-O-[3-hydroxymyristoyl] glucosamine N-acyltransferase